MATQGLPKICMRMSMIMTIILAFTHDTQAVQYTVGGANGWTLGSNMQQWVSQHKFYVGDDLYFPYAKGQSNVLLVSVDDFKACRVDHPITSDAGEGDMVISLDQPESYYFISGVANQCSKGLRLQIDVQPASDATTTPSSTTTNGGPNNIGTSTNGGADVPGSTTTTLTNTPYRNSAPSLYGASYIFIISSPIILLGNHLFSI